MSAALVQAPEQQMSPAETLDSFGRYQQQRHTITIEEGRFRTYGATYAIEPNEWLTKNPVVAGLRNIYENTSESPKYGTLPYINFIFGTPNPTVELHLRLRIPSVDPNKKYLLQNHVHSFLKSLLILSKDSEDPSQLCLELQPAKGTRDPKAQFINVSTIDISTGMTNRIRTGNEIGRGREDYSYAIHTLRRWLGHKEELYPEAVDISESSGTQEDAPSTEVM
jgi:hypothetical protein